MTVETTTCKACNTDTEIQNDIHDLRKQGESFQKITDILQSVGVSISPSSLRRHFDNHVSVTVASNKAEQVPMDDGSLGSVTTDLGGGEFKDIKTNEPITDWTCIFERFNLDPNSFEIVDNTVRMSSWQQTKKTEEGSETVNLYSYRARFKRKVELVNEVDLQTLVNTVQRRAQEPMHFSRSQQSDLGVVTCFSDLQVGKTDHRGGTPELLDRAYESLERYTNYLQEHSPKKVLFADLGDIVEGFNSTASEMFTNDLSIMDQVDLAHTIVSEFLTTTAENVEEVVAVGVPSNHAAWRNGKNYLGTPADDWGLHILRMIEKEYDKYSVFNHVSFKYPKIWDKSINVDLMGTGVGMTHGDDWSGGPKGADAWWQKQQHGGGPTSRSDILVHGHYHTYETRMSGRTPEGRQKYIISATTLDSGSSWFANGSGGTDSEAGLTVFGVREGTGLDLSTLRILK